MAGKHRLIARGDLDGVVSAAMLRSRGLVDEVVFAEPNDIQSGRVSVTENDVLAGLPYVQQANMVYSHSAAELERIGGQPPANLVLDPAKGSTARVIYDQLGGRGAFSKVSDDLLYSVEDVDAARFTEFEQVFEPTGWTLLGYILDPRTGLDQLPFKTSGTDLRRKLVDSVLTSKPEDLLKRSELKERVERYTDEEAKARDQIKANAAVHDNLVVVDLRNEATLHPVNRFVVYTMYPKQNISLTITADPSSGSAVFAVGRSIVNQGSQTDVGKLMARFGGGGHAGAGTCRVPADHAERVLGELVTSITRDG